MSEGPRFVLDAVGDPVEPPAHGPTLLGHDPFSHPPGPDPFLARLDEVLRDTARPPPSEQPETRQAPDRRRRQPRALDDPEPAGHERTRGVRRLLGENVLRRLATLDRLVSETGYDAWGLEPEAVKSALPFFLALYRGWFRVKSEGHEHVPTEGAAVLAANHAGLLPFDGAMTAVDLFLHTDPPRLARAVVDRWAGGLPFVGVFLARMGQVVGTRENVAGLLRDQQLMLVFPEGMEGIRKPVTQRYRLQHFHVGFVEEALRAAVPIVPTAIIGSENQAPILFDVKPLARLLRLPTAPITPTFPWLGPLGLLPYPVSYRIVYGEPLAFHERFGPEAADDARLVRYLTQQVRRTVQRLVDRERP